MEIIGSSQHLCNLWGIDQNSTCKLKKTELYILSRRYSDTSICFFLAYQISDISALLQLLVCTRLVRYGSGSYRGNHLPVCLKLHRVGQRKGGEEATARARETRRAKQSLRNDGQ